MDNQLTIGEAGSLLLGAGLVQIATNVNIALILIGVGAALKITVATLQKQGVPVEAPAPGK